MNASLKDSFPSLDHFHRGVCIEVTHKLIERLNAYVKEAPDATKGSENARKIFPIEFPGTMLIDDCSAEDKEAFKAALKKLHQTCQKKDVAIDIMGFESLPTLATVTKDSLAARPAPAASKRLIAICLDLGSPYNYLCNPYDDGAVLKALKQAAQTKPGPQQAAI